MSFGFGFALPAYPLRGGGGNNPFNQSGPTLDLSFVDGATNVGNQLGADTYTLDTNFITPQYQVAAQYAVWVAGSGLTQRNFADIVTFTRGSTATYFNSAGTLTTAAINEARFDFNPSTLAAQGLLIEEQRTNSIRNNTMVGAVNSTGIASATVASGGTGYTVGNVLTVSGGTGTAATFTVTGASAGVITSVSVTTAGSYTVFPTSPVSVTGGSGSGATFNIVLNGTLPSSGWSVFTALTGLTRTIVGTGTENGIAYIDIQLSGTPSAAGNYFINFENSTQVVATNGQTWTSSLYCKLVAGTLTGISSVRISTSNRDSGGLSLGLAETAFTPTASALSSQRISSTLTNASASTAFELSYLVLILTGVAIDITLRIGLPQLENNNISTGVASATVASGGSGYAVGDVLQIVGGTASTAARLTVATLSGSAVATVTVSTAGSYSVFPSPQPVSVTAITGTGTSATFNIVPQAQSGFATSVIPTTVAAATRSADVASVDPLSPWFNATEGTLFAQYIRAGLTVSGGAAGFDDGTANNMIRFVFGTAAPANQRFDVNTGGVSQATVLVNATGVVNTLYKDAGAYKLNDIAATENGAAVVVDTAATIPTVNILRLGTNPIGAYLNGWIQRITYYPRRLPNADLQTITA